MSRRKTHAEFVAEVEALVGDEYTVLGSYSNNSTKIKIRHNKCSYEYEVVPSGFLRGNSCPRCSGRIKTTEDFTIELFELFGDSLELLGEYKNAKTKVSVMCTKCGNSFERLPDSLLRKSKHACTKCNNNYNTKTNTEFLREVESIHGKEYTFLGTYKTARRKIKVRHNNCSYEYSVAPYSFLQGVTCPRCAGNAKKTTELFKREVFDLTKDEYTVLNEYKNTDSKIKIKHNKCSYEYEVTPNNFLRGSRCPNCNESKGEKAIAELLVKLSIPHDRQYKLDDCRYKSQLPFDFAVFNVDQSLMCLIEYDGKQHFCAVDHFGGEAEFKACQRRDKIKTQYCTDHKIPLIRIPYWKLSGIDEILTKELRKLGVIETENIAS